jgi:hypothetical protein
LSKQKALVLDLGRQFLSKLVNLMMALCGSSLYDEMRVKLFRIAEQLSANDATTFVRTISSNGKGFDIFDPYYP